METQYSDQEGRSHELEGRLRAAVCEANVDLAPAGMGLHMSRADGARGEFVVRCTRPDPAPGNRFASLTLVGGMLESRVHAEGREYPVADHLSLAEATPEQLYDRMAFLAEALVGVAE